MLLWHEVKDHDWRTMQLKRYRFYSHFFGLYAQAGVEEVRYLGKTLGRNLFRRVIVCFVSCQLLTGCGTMPVPQAEGPLKEVALHAISLVDVPYRYSGNTPDSGFDCSGLITYVVKRTLGLSLPRTVKEMSQYGLALPTSELLPGDLVFFNTSGQTYSHAGIYIGENRFVHAPSTGGQVRLDSLNKPYWAQRFVAARRLVVY